MVQSFSQTVRKQPFLHVDFVSNTSLLSILSMYSRLDPHISLSSQRQSP